jgi:hypothetical protein
LECGKICAGEESDLSDISKHPLQEGEEAAPSASARVNVPALGIEPASAALHWLGEAERLHDATLVELRVDSLLDPIRNEPQFKTIDGRMNFPP